MQTSAKVRLTSIAIRTRIRDPGRHTKISPFVHWPIASIPWEFHANPFWSFCEKLLTDIQTDRQQRRKHNLLGGRNNGLSTKYWRNITAFRYRNGTGAIIPNVVYILERELTSAAGCARSRQSATITAINRADRKSFVRAWVVYTTVTSRRGRPVHSNTIKTTTAPPFFARRRPSLWAPKPNTTCYTRRYTPYTSNYY